MVLSTVVNSRDDTESVAKDVETIRSLLPGPDGSPVRSFVTGEAGFEADRSAAVEGLDGTLLAITGVLVLVLMLLTYRSPLIAALMLGVVAIAYLIATGLVYGLVQADLTTVSGQSTAILIVLMFGAGTDYCLLIVSRFRDELRHSSDVEAAMTRAAEHTGPAIFASGGIVVAAMLVLSLADFNATREMGPLLALGIVVMMGCGVTLLPALLAAFGRRAFWPAIPRARRPTHARRARAGPASARSCGAGRRCSSPSPWPCSCSAPATSRNAAISTSPRAGPGDPPSPPRASADPRTRRPAGAGRAGPGGGRRRGSGSPGRGMGCAEAPGVAVSRHRLRVAGRLAPLPGRAAEPRPVLDAGDGHDPAPARGRAAGRRATRWR